MHLHQVHGSPSGHFRHGLDGGQLRPADLLGEADLTQEKTGLFGFVKIVDFFEEIVGIELADFVEEVDEVARGRKFRSRRRRLVFRRRYRE